MKKAFTLIELLVVIGIIGILAGTLVASLSGGGEAARAAKCLSNMKSIAGACQSILMESGAYPFATSFEYSAMTASRKGVKSSYDERKGWIGWNSDGAYRKDSGGNGPTSHKSSSAWMCSAYSGIDDSSAEIFAKACITNGSVAAALSYDTSVYVCPDHVAAAKKEGLKPNWSYVMNGYFKWDTTRGAKWKSDKFSGRYRDNVTQPDRVLLLAELPFTGTLVNFSMSSSFSDATDQVLQYAKLNVSGNGKKGATANLGSSEYGNEIIGFNHKSAKRWCAHVAFADGHVEKILAPKDGSGNLQELTSWLCEGVSYSFDGQRYQPLDN